MFGDLLINWKRKVGIHLVKIYAFCGVMGSGKGYSCQQLIDNEDFIQIDFADCLRDMVWKMLDWQPENAEEYDLFKKGKFFIPRYGKINGRLLLQRIGATMREIDPDFWVKQHQAKIERAISMGYNNICISDARYKNELESLLSNSWQAEVKITFCDYHSERYDADNTHESEKMAQRLLELGFKDGDRITRDDLNRL